MIIRVCLFFFFASVAQGQYEDYESYQTFTDLDKYQRDYGLIFTPSFIYMNVDENNSAPGQVVSSRSRNILFYDMKFGYIFRGGFYFGLLYAGESQNINTSRPESTRESLGMSFGYIRWGWALTATFFPYSKQTLTGASDVSEYADGLGFQADVAYYFRLGNHVSVGPQLVYKSINYSEAEAATGNLDYTADSQHSVLTPMITLIFNIYRG